MYYIEELKGKTFVYNKEDKGFIFGPFNDSSDAYLVCEMFNKGKLTLELTTHGKEDIKDTHTVHEYAAE